MEITNAQSEQIAKRLPCRRGKVIKLALYSCQSVLQYFWRTAFLHSSAELTGLAKHFEPFSQ